MVVKLFKNNSKIPSENIRKMWDKELDPARKQFIHINVVQTLGAGYQMAKDNQGRDLYKHFFIVTEYAANGELFDLVKIAGGLETCLARTLFK